MKLTPDLNSFSPELMHSQNQKLPRISFVINSLGGGGAEKVFITVVEYLRKFAQIQVILFKSEGVYLEKLNTMPEVSCVELDKKKGHLSMVLQLKEVWKIYHPERVVSFMEYPNILVSLSLIGSSIKHISSERMDYRSGLGNGTMDKLKKVLLPFVFKRAWRIIPVSEALGNRLIHDFKADPQKIFSIPNGINLSELTQLSQKQLPENIPFLPDRFTFISAGRFHPAKNQELLIRAFARINNQYPNTRLILLGTGELESELKKLALILGIEKLVYFPGFDNNVQRWISRAGTFVLSSNYEGMPNALLEAFFVNGHCVSTDCPTGPSEIISSGYDGILVPPGDIDALTQAMTKMCIDDDFRTQVYQHSRIKATQFDLCHVLKTWKSVILNNNFQPSSLQPIGDS
ncbi:MAG: glycosyltransferase [Sphingobacteriia bacterium]|nr:glycosyltransferase [Sphingobacteriia bacterium]